MSRSGKKVAILFSPFQVLCFATLLRTDSSLKNGLEIFLKYSSEAENNSQLQKTFECLLPEMKCSVLALNPTSSMFSYLKLFFSSAQSLISRRRNLNLFISDPFSIFVRLFRKAKIVLIDDGTQTIIIGKLLKDKAVRNRVTKVATLFGQIEGLNEIEHVDISKSLEEQQKISGSNEAPVVAILGANFVELGVLSAVQYRKILKDICNTHGASVYFPHRREKPENTELLALELGLKVVRLGLPFECIFILPELSQNIETLIAFGSTALFTSKLMDKNLRIVNVEVKPSTIPVGTELYFQILDSVSKKYETLVETLTVEV